MNTTRMIAFTKCNRKSLLFRKCTMNYTGFKGKGENVQKKKFEKMKNFVLSFTFLESQTSD